VTFSSADLLASLQSLPVARAYWVAFSGGLDSHVLLHAMERLRDRLEAPLHAVHVHHGLQQQADAWEAHCRSVCAELDVPLQVRHLDLQPAPGESVEAIARDARYRAIGELLGEQHMLLTAQHRDDQAETLLLQLLRGAGIEGLAAMPMCKQWGQGWHARPLLPVARADLHDYARRHRLQWVEDPSNLDIRFDRNYLRRQVMPVLQQRWPSAAATIARSAAHLAASLQTIAGQAAADLQTCLGSGQRLQIAALLSLPEARRQATLRAWLRAEGQALPDQARMQQIEYSVLRAGADAAPVVSWADIAVRAYRGELWLTRARLPEPPQRSLAWGDTRQLELPAGLGRLQRQAAGAGIPDRLWREGRVSVRWRGGDASCRLPGRQGTRSFRKLCQELAIPGWRRPYLPLLYVDDSLAAVASYCVCGDWPCGSGEPCSSIQWDRPELL